MVESESNWLPLESNPYVINQYVEGLGFDVNQFSFYDMIGIEDWAQEMIPQPILAVMLLFPIKDNTTDFDDQQQEKIQDEGQILSKDIFFMKQYAQNACGTVGIMHAISNNYMAKENLIKKDSFCSRFIEKTKNQTPEERGKFFENNKDLEQAHKSAVEAGESQVDDYVNTHFICFIHKEGYLYELDGRKEFPINHGKTTAETLLFDTCNVIKNVFLERDPGEIRFTVLALARSENAEDDAEDQILKQVINASLQQQQQVQLQQHQLNNNSNNNQQNLIEEEQKKS